MSVRFKRDAAGNLVFNSDPYNDYTAKAYRALLDSSEIAYSSGSSPDGSVYFKVESKDADLIITTIRNWANVLEDISGRLTYL